MAKFLGLLRQSVVMTSIDVDNALYTTAAIQPLTPQQQKKAIFWTVVIEFVGRIVLLWLFLYLFNAKTVLFTLFGVEFTPETLSLFSAGAFLLSKNSLELLDFFRGGGEVEEPGQAHKVNFFPLLLQMGMINTLMSIDTVIAITGVTHDSFSILFILLFSATIRLLFVQQIATFMQKYPAINIVVLTFLILIGAELMLQGFGLDYEALFNTVLVVALLLAIVYHQRYTKAVTYP